MAPRLVLVGAHGNVARKVAMGIYPDIKWEDDPDGLHVRRITSTPGLTRTETFRLINKVEERTECYCCSCPDPWGAGGWSGHDPCCRNHGFAATRVCDIHNLPGDRFVPDVESGLPTTTPLLTVLQERARNSG